MSGEAWIRTTTRSRAAVLLLVVLAAAAVVGVGLGRDRHTPSSVATGVDADSVRSLADAELAARAVDRLQLFRDGSRGGQLRLTAEEVTAVLRHAVPGMLPAGVVDPVVRLESGAVLVEARLVSAEFAGSAPIATVLGVLADTLDVDLRGRLEGAGDQLIFRVERARASQVPLPGAVVSAVARALAQQGGDRTERPAGDATFSFRWPEDVALVAIIEDRFVLERGERILDQAVDGIDDP